MAEDVFLADKLVQKAWAHSCGEWLGCVTVAGKKALFGHGRMIARGCERRDGWAIVDAVKRHVLLLLLLSFPVLMVSGQSIAWIDYLNGDSFDRARLAATTVEIQIEAWLVAKLERMEQLQMLYVSARREARAGGGAGSDEVESLASIRAALDSLGAVLRDQPPNAGSFSSREAIRWLTEVAAVLGAQVDEVADLVGLVQSQGQNASDAAAEAFLTSIDLPAPAGFGDASVQDQLIQVAEHWWILFLCAPDDNARAQMLSGLHVATRSFSAEASARAADLAREYRSSAVQVEHLKQVIADALPTLGARTVVALSTGGSPAPEGESFSLLLTEMHGMSREDLFIAATVDAATRFTIEVTERLLSALSDRQALELGRVAGLGIGDVRMIAGHLYRVRLDLAETARISAEDAARTAADWYRRSDVYQDQTELLLAHRADAQGYVSGLEPWVTGGQSRAGDSYRWALLSVLSNRYAQHLLLTSPTPTDVQRLVGEFVSGLYEGMAQRLPDALAERLQRDAAIDVADSYDRGYRLSLDSGRARFEDGSEDGSELELIYRSFVREAQGHGSTNEIFASSSGSEPSIASDWAHTHGLHVSASDPDARTLPLHEAALIWFTLANNAQNEMQGFAHAIRGVLSLASAIDYLVEPALRDSGDPAVQLYDPRLAVARDYLAIARGFEVTPGETIAVLYRLYPEAKEIAVLIGELDRSVEALGNRLAEVEAADRRLIQFASGARR